MGDIGLSTKQSDMLAVTPASPGDDDGHQQAVEALKSINSFTIYDADPRPTFIVDTVIGLELDQLVVVYTNRAFDEQKDLVLCLKEALQTSSGFNCWILSNKIKKNHYRYGGVLWFEFLVQNRWRVVSTTSSLTEPDNAAQCPLTTPAIGRTKDSNSSNQNWYEGEIKRLKEELRVHDYGRKQAAKERQNCWESVQRLRKDLKALEASTPPQQMQLDHSVSGGEEMPALASRHQSDSVLPRASISCEKDPRVTKYGKKPSAAPTVQSLHQRRRSSSFLSKQILPVRMTGDGDISQALEKFQQLAEAVDVGFFDYNTSGRLIHANDSWYALSGHPRDPEQHTELSFQKCIYPGDEELVMSHWQRLLQGEPVTFEMRWKRPKSPEADPADPPEAQWVLSACVPVIDDTGKVQSISGCTTDINAQKQSIEAAMQRAEALERARASEERFSRFAEVAPIAIFRIDKLKNLEYCNDRWFEMTGLPKTSFEQVAWPFGVHEEDIERCSQAWEKAMADRSIGQIEFRLQKEWHDANNRRGQSWVYCTFFAESADDGSFNGLMGSLLDISHLKWAENMQKMRAEEALEAKRQQENFIDITSHEMRNPLSAMVQCADSIMTSLDDATGILSRTKDARAIEENKKLREDLDTGLDAVQTILSCAAHQKRIVDDILTLSKLDSNLLLITPVKTEPIEMVQGIIKMFEMDSTKADVDLNLEYSDTFQKLNINWLMLDPSRVSQILINLLGNAIKFTRTEKLKRVTVRMSASFNPPSRDDTRIEYVPAEIVADDVSDTLECGSSRPIYLKFEVQDTGCGLTADERAKLFFKFSQASPKTHVQYGGSGLGLFISRKLTEMQGGEIGFASEASVGSTFAFYVKTRRTCAPVSEGGLSLSKTNSNSTLNNSNKITRRKRNVLLVEDNLVNQKVLGAQLKKQNCVVHIAGHGVEALDFLKKTDLWSEPSEDSDATADPIPLDLVLMDIEMPVMGGLECTSQIRKLQAEKQIKRHLPIISISANARQEQVNEAMAAGVDDAITKPFRIQELVPKMNNLTGTFVT